MDLSARLLALPVASFTLTALLWSAPVAAQPAPPATLSTNADSAAPFLGAPAPVPPPATALAGPATTTYQGTSVDPTRRMASDPIAWPYPLFRPAEYATTAVVGVAAIGAFFIAKPQTNVHWSGGILFDDAVRSALRLHSQSARTTVRTISNVTAVTPEVFVIGVDSILVPIARGRLTMAEQLVLMDAEAYAFSSLLTTTVFDVTGRARPSYADCQRNPNYDILCNSAPTASFWSGHTAEAFTGAGLSCAHHAYAHVYGDPLADAMACAGMIVVSSATGTLRLLGDRHYATDVASAAIVGFGLGYGMPTLLHYAWLWGGSSSGQVSAALSPMSGGVGLRVGGAF